MPDHRTRCLSYIVNLCACAGLFLLGCSSESDAMPTSRSQSATALAESGTSGSPQKTTTSAAGTCASCVLPTTKATVVESPDKCGNGLDDDGNGKVDNDCDCARDSSQRCFAGTPALAGVGACQWGKQNCMGKDSDEFPRWGACVGQGEPGVETCDDEIDNDCDGQVDEDCGCKEGSRSACTSICGMGERVCHDHQLSACSARTPSVEMCNGIDDDCDGQVDNFEIACSSACGSGHKQCSNGSWSSCSAREPRTETCNGVDDDCDGTIDDIEMPCSSACGSGRKQCSNGTWSSCSAPAPRTETCNGVDDDCDGTADDGLSTTWSFENICDDTRMFIARGGCNACQSTCNGYWVDPGDSRSFEVEEDGCITISVFARTSNGDSCLDLDGSGTRVGETHEFCNKSCRPAHVTMHAEVEGGC